jgi:hypothetical protein
LDGETRCAVPSCSPAVRLSPTMIEPRSCRARRDSRKNTDEQRRTYAPNAASLTLEQRPHSTPNARSSLIDCWGNSGTEKCPRQHSLRRPSKTCEPEKAPVSVSVRRYRLPRETNCKRDSMYPARKCRRSAFLHMGVASSEPLPTVDARMEIMPNACTSPTACRAGFAPDSLASKRRAAREVTRR